MAEPRCRYSGVRDNRGAFARTFWAPEFVVSSGRISPSCVR